MAEQYIRRAFLGYSTLGLHGPNGTGNVFNKPRELIAVQTRQAVLALAHG